MNSNHVEIISSAKEDSLVKQSEGIRENPLLNKDIWRIKEDLNLKINGHSRNWTLNFIEISPEWLKQLIKSYILMRAKKNYAINTLRKDLTALKNFALFLQDKSIYKPEQINNQVFEEFENYLVQRKQKKRSMNICFGTLANFFDTCRRSEWIDINTYWFRGKCKSCHSKNYEINYLPEEVWNQLDKNLHYLPEAVQRMVLIIRTLGLRVGELCNLPFDCLVKRNGKWRLRLTTEKYDIEDELPLVETELVAIIQEQQKYIGRHLDLSYKFLFCANQATGLKSRNQEQEQMVFEPSPTQMSGNSFNRWLNRLARKCNICTSNGELWHFTSHQFRRTVATVMTNAKVRDLIIQKYLRHRSPDMQNFYKHLLKQVLAEEMDSLMKDKKYIDITGKLVESYRPTNLVTEALRRRMNQITTQYGECHRPILNNHCPTINACWSCQHWRCSMDDLPYLQSDLNRVSIELETAISLGMVRQQQGLEINRNQLTQVISSLSGMSNGY